jgi:hypothetical protein
MRFSPDILAARWRLGLVTGEELPDLATDLLLSGTESPAVVALAGESGTTLRDAGRLFERVLADLGCARLDECGAGRILARDWAERIVRGELDPYEGASQIWRVSYYACNEPSDLVPFVGLASQYQDSEAYRVKLREDIIQAARRYLSAPDTSPA